MKVYNFIECYDLKNRDKGTNRHLNFFSNLFYPKIFGFNPIFQAFKFNNEKNVNNKYTEEIFHVLNYCENKII
jgi:hypothetical protein